MVESISFERSIISDMNITAEQLRLVKRINDHVNQYPDTDAGTKQMLMTLYDYMDSFKQVMDTTTKVEMDYLIQQYDGFYRFAKLLEQMAQGISDGSIPCAFDSFKH